MAVRQPASSYLRRSRSRPSVPAPFPPTEAPPETPAGPGAEERAARPALIAPDWPLGQRVRPRRRRACHGGNIASARERRRRGHSTPRRPNAVDAAVAVAFPRSPWSIQSRETSGGGGFMVIRQHDGGVHALDFPRGGAIRSHAAPCTLDVGGERPGITSLTRATGSVGRAPGSVAADYTRASPPVRAPDVEGGGRARRRAGARWVHARRRTQSPDRPGSRAPRPASPPRAHNFSATQKCRHRARGSFRRTWPAHCSLIADDGPRSFYQGSVAELIVQGDDARARGLITRRGPRPAIAPKVA